MARARPLLLLLLYLLSVGGQAPQVRGPVCDQAIGDAAAIGGRLNRAHRAHTAQETFDEELLLRPLADNHLLVREGCRERAHRAADTRRAP